MVSRVLQTIRIRGMCFLASVTEVMFAQGQNPGSTSKADRDYVYARKRYKKGDFQVTD